MEQIDGNGNGYGHRCPEPECGEYLQVTSAANDWGYHLLCPRCGYSEPLESLEDLQQAEGVKGRIFY